MLAAGDVVSLAVTLVGVATSQADLVFAALAAAGSSGIGPDRVVLSMAGRLPEPIDTTAPMPERLRLTFTTPLRLTACGAPVSATHFRPRQFLGALSRRVSLLAHYHRAGHIALDFLDLKQRAAAAAFVATDLVWQDWARKSARQGKVIQMGGLMGTAVLPMEHLEPFWPLIQLAPALHVGKGATMGLGAVNWTSAS
jgi:hypothetical protein